MAATRSLRAGAARGALSLASGQGARFIVQVVSIVLLARLLPPHDFGLVAMVGAFVGISNLMSDFGFSAAVLRDSDMPRRTRDTLFAFNVLLAATSGLVLWCCAPLVADFYGDQRIEAITRALALVVPLSGVAPQYRAELAGKMKFGVLAAADPVAQALGLFAAVISVTVFDGGYWSLVVQQVVSATALLVIMVPASNYVPRSLPRWGAAKGYMSLSLSMLALQVMGYAASAAGTVALGRSAGASAVGIYTRAFQMFSLPLVQVAAPMTRVAVPVLARVPAEQREEAARRIQRVMCFALIPPLAAVAAGGPALFVVLLGANWSGAGHVVQLLAVGGVFQVLGYIHYWMFLTVNRLGWLTLWELPIWLVCTVLTLTVAPGNPYVVAGIYSVGLAAIWLLGGAFGFSRLGLTWHRVLGSSGTPLLLGAAIFAGGEVGRAVSARIVVPASGELFLEVLFAGLIASLVLVSRRCRSDIRAALAEFRTLRKDA